MPDTRRNLADLIALTPDNTTGDVGNQDLRDMLVSIYGTDAIFTGATKTASFTAAVGQIYPCDCSALTANMDVTFPATPAAGDVFGIYVSNKSTTAGGSGFAQGPYWCAEPLTSTSINGVSYVQATGDGGGRWGLFIVGEWLKFRWDAVASTWVAHSGKLPAFCSASMSAAITTNTAGTVKNIALDTLSGTDLFGMLNTSGGNFQIKRSGRYLITVGANPNSALAAGQYYIIGVGTASATLTVSAGSRASANSNLHRMRCNAHLNVLGGDSLWSMFQAQDTNMGAVNGTDLSLASITEIA